MTHDPDHLSPSSLYSYTSCPRAYYLSRVKKAEALPAWYFAVGTSVHRSIECYVKGEQFDVESLFLEEVEKSMRVEPDTSKWLHGGSNEDPVIEERALKLALDCMDRAVEFLDQMDVWHVELDVSGYLPGCKMKIMSFLDLIGEHRKKGPMIVDAKTGKSKPNNDQLETYNALTPEHIKRGTVFKGLYLMLNPDAAQARPIAFKQTQESMGKKYHELELAVKAKKAQTKHGFMCSFCTMKPNCTLESGSNARTRYYDTPEMDGWLPF